MRGFLGAVPGLDAYAMLGKAWWHTTERVNDRPRYDLVILDGPASGHATLMLRIPGAILAAMPKGPLVARRPRDRRAACTIRRAPRCVIVTLAEELPSRETGELAATARDDLRLPLGPLVVNAVPSDEAAAPPLGPVLDRPVTDADDPALRATLRLAATARAHRRLADQTIAGLTRDLRLPVLPLPRLPTVDVGPSEVAVLAGHLSRDPGRVPPPPR